LLRGQFRTAYTGLGISLFVTLLLTLRLDPAWVSDYLSNLRIFASANIPEVYAHAFSPQSMILFSSAFYFFGSLHKKVHKNSLKNCKA
jgi:hypothetical protein